MNPPTTPEMQAAQLPNLAQIPVQKQREMLIILSEMICRRMKQEQSDEPQQNS